MIVTSLTIDVKETDFVPMDIKSHFHRHIKLRSAQPPCLLSFTTSPTSYEYYKAAFDGDESDQLEKIAEVVAQWKLARFRWRVIGDEDYDQCLLDTFLDYSHLFDQQQQIMHEKRDYEALCAGLQCLPNITTVFALDSFFQCPDWIPVEIDDHSWYHEQSKREISVPIPPSTWYRHSFNEDYSIYQELGEWDVRGMRNLIRAVSQHGHKVLGLNIGSERSKAPGLLFGMDPDVWAHGCRLAQRLDILKMDLYSFAEEDYSDIGDDGHEDCLGSFLSEANKLRCLAISGHMNPNLLTTQSWPHLETLILADIFLFADQLREITETHQGTLREITFRHVILFGKEEFADVAKEIGIYLGLRRVCISKVGDEVGDYLVIEETKEPHFTPETDMAVARSFMHSIPRTTLSGDFDNGFTIVACPEENDF